MKKVAIVGLGHSKFGVRKDISLREMAYESVKGAIEDCNVGSVDEIEASVTGITSDEFAQQVVPAPIITDYIGMVGKPNVRVEAACATGSAAIMTAYSWIASGLYDIVLAVGAEKMHEAGTSHATEIMAMAGDSQWEYGPFGVTFPGFYAMLAIAHMAKFGTTSEQLAKIAVKNHKHGVSNPNAHMRKEITVEKVLDSFMVAYPLHLYDCCLITDGAAAIIMVSEEKAKELTDTPIWIEGIGCSTDTATVMERSTFTGINSTRKAAQMAYKMAGITIKDVDVATVHDCFTIAELLAYEDLDFCKKGDGGKLIDEGETYYDGSTPINTDGGLKSKGHPLGATGISMAVEISKQLRGEAYNQVEGAEIGLAHNVGGSGQYIFVNIYRR